MIIIDTNVVSELMSADPQPEVMAWLDGHPTNTLFTTTVTEAEILSGIAFLPDGKRRRGLARTAERLFDLLFNDRVLPFDSSAAQAYAQIAAARRAAGRPLSLADGQIAAIAHSRGASVATRNTTDFEGCGITIENPWPEE